MSANKKPVKITVEYADAIYELEADQECTVEYSPYFGSQLIAKSSKMFVPKPKPEPEKPKASVTVELDLGGKRYAGKLEEKKPEVNISAKPGWRFNDGFTD